MTERPTKNVAASVHQRLKNQAVTSGQVFNDLLQHYALERFLYRLSKSEHADLFVLEGALLLHVWCLSSIRPTRDIDLLGRCSNEVESVSAIIRDVCTMPVDADGLTFDAESVRAARIAEAAEYGGIRVEFAGALGSALIPMQIDIGLVIGSRPSPTRSSIQRCWGWNQPGSTPIHPRLRSPRSSRSCCIEACSTVG